MNKQEAVALQEQNRLLREQNKLLKDRIKQLEKRVSNDGWQYEADHVDDWRKPVEMGQL
jgi:hypothetical protein